MIYKAIKEFLGFELFQFLFGKQLSIAKALGIWTGFLLKAKKVNLFNGGEMGPW